MGIDKIVCGTCGNWIMGIPVGRCGHPAAEFLFTSNKMVDRDAGNECPLNMYKSQLTKETVASKYKKQPTKTKETVVIEFTKKEIRALHAVLWANPCNSGCVYEEMDKSKKDCNDCELTKSIISITNKIE